MNAALADFRVATSFATDQDLIDKLLYLKSVVRQAEHEVLQTIARLDSDGVFLERGLRTRLTTDAVSSAGSRPPDQNVYPG